MFSTFPPAACPGEAPSDGHRILQAALDLLEQGEALLRALPAEVYSTRIDLAFNASVGGHYRHCLDHFASVVRGLTDGVVDFDHRERDPQLEQDPVVALAVTRDLRAAIGRLPPALLEQSTWARCEISYQHGNPPVTRSSLGREWVYAIAHGIHHFALIAVMVRLQGCSLPPDFGVAPSTVRHRDSLAAHSGSDKAAIAARSCSTNAE